MIIRDARRNGSRPWILSASIQLSQRAVCHVAQGLAIFGDEPPTLLALDQRHGRKWRQLDDHWSMAAG
jgi:hypothetical protein